MTRSRQSIVLIGRPNVGKTSVFNRLTGLNLKTANYGGVTVEHAEGTLTLQGEQVTLIDLPGACSLSPHSPDEALISSTLIMGGLGVVDLVISVIDANRLVESLYLTLQVIELGYPTVVAINQLDVAQEMGVSLDMRGLQADLQCPVVGISAKTGEGLEELLTVAQHTLTQSTSVQLKSEPSHSEPSHSEPSHSEPSHSEPSHSEPSHSEPTHRALPWTEPLPPQSRETALWSLIKGEYSGDQLTYDAIVQWAIHTAHLTESPLSPTMRLLALEASPVLSSVCEERIQRRYDWLDQKFLAWVTQEDQADSSSTPLSTTQHIDRWVLHPFFGSLIFFLWMLILFQLLFAGADPFIQWIEIGVEWVRSLAVQWLPQHLLCDFLIEGVINGVGNVVVFLPQVILLFALVGLMEDSGYMARASALMDRIMRSLGLSGRAFVPMFSGFVCAVPAILATRTLPQRRDRFLTMMTLPLMTCSARLPVYTLLISVLVPSEYIFFGFSGQAWVMIGLYCFATLIAFIAIAVLGRTILRGEPPPLLLELPEYRMPTLADVWRRVLSRSSIFMREAGTVILLGTMVLWVLLSFPRVDVESLSDSSLSSSPLSSSPLSSSSLSSQTNLNSSLSVSAQTQDTPTLPPEKLTALQREHSWGGQIGKWMEPVLKPLGWDWQVGVGILGAFAAREVFISTLGVVYGIRGEVNEDTPKFREHIRAARHMDGSPVFTPLSALSLLIFFALACQCMSTLAVVKRETGGYMWPLFLFSYMSVLAYISALAVYQGGRWIGFS